MKWVKIIGSLLLLAIILFGITFSTPIDYNVEAFIARKGTQFWQLDDGISIGYTKVEAITSEKKEPIIYLLGGPGGRVSDEVIEVLSPLKEEGHDIYFYDQIGSGHSTRLENIGDYTVERHKEDLRRIVQFIGADKITLIAHSWGACLAMNYLQEFPKTVNKIVLSGPGPILPINRSLAHEIPPDSLNPLEPEFSNKEGNEKVYNWRTKIIYRWAYMFNSKLRPDQEMDDFFTSLNQELNKSTYCYYEKEKKYKGGGGFYSHIMTAKSFNYVKNKRDKLKELKTPILILRGQCDNQKWGYAKEYLDLFNNSTLKIIDGVGHSIINKKAEEYYSMIRSFLDEGTSNYDAHK